MKLNDLPSPKNSKVSLRTVPEHLSAALPFSGVTTSSKIQEKEAVLREALAKEIGFPYSDPVMDGPVIQAASEQAIKNGAGVDQVFELLQTTAASGTASVIMSYWSPIEKYGVANFAKRVAQLGGSGVITPDLTIEESL